MRAPLTGRAALLDAAFLRYQARMGNRVTWADLAERIAQEMGSGFPLPGGDVVHKWMRAKRHPPLEVAMVIARILEVDAYALWGPIASSAAPSTAPHPGTGATCPTGSG